MADPPREEESARRARGSAGAAKHVTGTKPSHDWLVLAACIMTPHTGRQNRIENGPSRSRGPASVSPLEHYHYDTFQANAGGSPDRSIQVERAGESAASTFRRGVPESKMKFLCCGARGAGHGAIELRSHGGPDREVARPVEGER